MSLPSEGPAFSKPGFATGGLAQYSVATNAQYYGLSMTENCCDFVATWTFHIHEVRVWALHKTLLLVLSPFFFLGGMQ